MNLPPHTRAKIFNNVCNLVETKHFDPAMNGVDWAELVQRRRDQILACTEPETFEKEVHAVLAELKTSHTGFRRAGDRNIPARLAINATLQRIDVNGNQRWMFQDVHRGGSAHSAGIRPGDLLLECDGREVRPPEMLSFSGGESANLVIETLYGGHQIVNIRLTRSHFNHHGPLRKCIGRSQAQGQSASHPALAEKACRLAGFNPRKKGNCERVSLIGRFWTVILL